MLFGCAWLPMKLWVHLKKSFGPLNYASFEQHQFLWAAMSVFLVWLFSWRFFSSKMCCCLAQLAMWHELRWQERNGLIVRLQADRQDESNFSATEKVFLWTAGTKEPQVSICWPPREINRWLLNKELWPPLMVLVLSAISPHSASDVVRSC